MSDERPYQKWTGKNSVGDSYNGPERRYKYVINAISMDLVMFSKSTFIYTYCTIGTDMCVRVCVCVCAERGK